MTIDDKKTRFQQCYETQQLVQKLEAIAKDKSYDVLTYEKIRDIIGRDPQTDGRGIVTSARRIVERDASCLFGVVARVGIKLLSPQEQIGIPDDTMRAIRNKTRRTIDRMTNTEYSALTDEQKKHHNTQASVLGAIAVFSSPKSYKKIEQKVQTAPMDLGDTLRLFGGDGK